MYLTHYHQLTAAKYLTFRCSKLFRQDMGLVEGLGDEVILFGGITIICSILLFKCLQMFYSNTDSGSNQSSGGYSVEGRVFHGIFGFKRLTKNHIRLCLGCLLPRISHEIHLHLYDRSLNLYSVTF